MQGQTESKDLVYLTMTTDLYTLKKPNNHGVHSTMQNSSEAEALVKAKTGQTSFMDKTFHIRKNN